MQGRGYVLLGQSGEREEVREVGKEEERWGERDRHAGPTDLGRGIWRHRPCTRCPLRTEIVVVMCTVAVGN